MATLTVQDAPVTGLADISFVAADALGDEAASGLGVGLLVRNDDTVSHTVTLDTPGTVRGLLIENPDVVVPAGAIGLVPLVRQVFSDPAAWTYDAVTSVTVAVVRLAR